MPFGAIASIFNGIMNYAQNNENMRMQRENQEWNRQFQREAFEYQKKLNELQMQREDTAVTRAMADYQANGINPLMALENGGFSSNGGTTYSPAQSEAVQGNATQLEQFEIGGTINNMMSLAQGIAQYNHTKKQNELLDAEIKSSDLRYNILESEHLLNKLALAKGEDERNQIILEGLNSYIDYLQKVNDYGINREAGLRSNDSTDPKINTGKKVLSDLMGDNGEETIKNMLKGFWNSEAGKQLKKGLDLWERRMQKNEEDAGKDFWNYHTGP